MEKRPITVIDETLREGMQYRGLMFSSKQRLKILEFQETLKVDICQAGYPPAHEKEAQTVKLLSGHARKNGYKICIAAMGRANIHDAAILLDTNISDLHFHVHIKNNISKKTLDSILHDLLNTINFVKEKKPNAVISIAMLDIGKSNDHILEQCVCFLDHHRLNILSLPDTSGMMAPNQVYEKIRHLCSKTLKTKISIHCHNDLGMASANSVMGIAAGGRILEASALGIGERNGIADLYTTAKSLKDQGFKINLKTDDIKTFKAYYEYLDSIVYEQTRKHLLNINTPFFGDAVKTHVAGTHAGGEYGMASEEQFFLNVLCGRYLVKKYLDSHSIDYSNDILDALTVKIKLKSNEMNRCLTASEIKTLISLS